MIQPANTPPPRQDEPPYEKGEPVALFVPCYVDQFYPEVARATAKLLGKFGAGVVYPVDEKGTSLIFSRTKRGHH